MVETSSSSDQMIAGPLQPEVFRDPAAVANFEQLVEEWSADAAAKHASPEQTPTITEDGRGLHFDAISLYRGSATAGIEEFGASSDTTIGAGLYATSMPDQALGYAVIRADDAEDGRRFKTQKGIVEPKDRPTVYEITMQDVTFLDLRQSTIFEPTMRGFTDYLDQKVAEGVLDRHGKPLARFFQAAADKIRGLETLHPWDLKGLLLNDFEIGEAFSDFVRSQGYDGLISEEGGESLNIAAEDTRYAGEHDSWVIMYPEKAHPTKSVVFDTPEVFDLIATERNQPIKAQRRRVDDPFGAAPLPPGYKVDVRRD